MKKLKAGIIGCGFIANGKHLPSMTRIEGVEVVHAELVVVAVDQLRGCQAAGAVRLFGDADLQAGLDQRLGGEQAGGAGTDHQHVGR